MRLCAFDIETTGTDRQHDQILQIAAVAFMSESGETIGEFEKTIHWERIEGDPYAIAMNSRLIERIAMKDSTTPLWDALGEFQTFLGDCFPKRYDDPPHPVGFNVAAFDLAFIEQHERGHNLFHRRAIELGTLLMSVSGSATPVSSKEAVTLLGTDRVVAHDALQDSRDARDLYMHWRRSR